MDSFELMANISDLLRGKDRGIWYEILSRTLKHEDPYTVRAPQVKILDVAWPENVEPENLVAHLQKKGCAIDEKIIAAFELEKRREHFRFLKTMHVHHRLVMIEFRPSAFGVEYDTCKRATFGIDATIGYQKVANTATKYGFIQPDLISALYFRNRFWDAHRYTEGTSYYVGCKPFLYAVGCSPIIPVLGYDRYRGWFLRAEEIVPDKSLNVDTATGQGEHFESTFVFVLPLQQ